MVGATLKPLMYSHKTLYTCKMNGSDIVTKNNNRHSIKMNAKEKYGAHVTFIFGCMHDSYN